MSQPKILVVEDEPIIRDLIVDFLTGEGYEPLSAGDGATALDIAREEQPDIVLLDMMLPAMDGAAVVKELRSKRGKRPARVIAMSADARMLRAATALKVDDVLPKPFNLLDLLDMITSQTSDAANHG